MKKILSILIFLLIFLICLLTLSVSSETLPIQKNDTNIEKRAGFLMEYPEFSFIENSDGTITATTDPNGKYELVSPENVALAGSSVYEYYYAQLTDESKLVYNLIKANSPTYGNIEIPLSLTKPITESGVDRIPPQSVQNSLFTRACDIIFDAKNAFVLDHAEIFWQKYGATATIASSYSNGKYVYTLKPGIVVKIDEKYSVIAQSANESMKQVISNFSTSKTSNIDIAKEIHDYLCSATVYDLNYEYSHEPYGLFVNGRTVCEGYAEAFKILCDKYSIPCVLVVGNGVTSTGSEPHMWNYISIDSNKWYAVDVTWDDQTSGLIYDYFMAGANTLDREHTKFSNSHQEDPVYYDDGNTSTIFTYPKIEQDAYCKSIYTKEDLFDFIKYPFFDATLMNDIVFGEKDFLPGGAFYNNGIGFTPIPEFSRVFDGNGYSICGLKINVKNPIKSDVGFISTNTGTVKNLGFYDCKYYAANNVATYVGGICGTNIGTIEGCYFSGTIGGSVLNPSVNLGLGGLVGYNIGTVKNSYFNGTLSVGNDNTSYAIVGGIVAFYDGALLENCYSIGTYNCPASPIGGICGHAFNYANISNSYCDYKNVSGNSNIFDNTLYRSNSSLTNLANYTNFDNTIWQICKTGSYPYAQLIKTKYFTPQEKLVIKSLPLKKIYRVGQAFDSSGMLISAVSGGTESIITPIITGFDSTVARQINITASYGGKEVHFTLEIRLDVLSGDVNGDGIVNISDAVVLLRHLSNPELIILDDISKEAADLIFDRKISIADMIKFKQYLADPTGIDINW